MLCSDRFIIDFEGCTYLSNNGDSLIILRKNFSRNLDRSNEFKFSAGK